MGPPGLPHWFFTSYSDIRSNFPLVERFHQDVEREVGQILGRQTPGKGFVDARDIKPGELWEDRIVRNGVCTTMAMLVLYSPSYFQSHWCAREWTVFTARVGRHRYEGCAPSCLIGVLWQKGKQDWPDAVNAYHYVRRGPDSVYEKHGLVHLVPRGPEWHESPEYREIVLEVADLVADARTAALPHIRVGETAHLRPPFGPESDLPVDFVVAYTEQDRGWGEWVHACLDTRGSVDVLRLDGPADPRGDRLSITLRRAGRVVLLVSRHSLTVGPLRREALETAFADPGLCSDLAKLTPFFIEDVPDEARPPDLLPLSGGELHGVPDTEAVQDMILTAVKAPVTGPAVVQRAEPEYPPNAVSPFERTLAHALALVPAVGRPDARDVWFELTGLAPGNAPSAELPTLLWAFAVVRAGRQVPHGYERIALALESIAPDSQETLQVRSLVDGHKAAPDL
ncbi:TIR domain-containing protein [Streptomyces sp. NPDC059906]|uniref:TIR domain-containing protein n=1 Tax=Streptomyces sp. NPDC059906 TaxID=3346997 RepID=UPI003651AF0E